MNSENLPFTQRYRAFPTTQWSLIRRVQRGPASDTRQAMEIVCERYWYPLYAYLRRSGESCEDAKDVTQALFQQLIERDTLMTLREGGAKLRTFLVECLHNLLADRARHAAALKRGGKLRHISFDEMGAEERYACEPRDVRDPERIFEQAWAHTLLTEVLAELRESFTKTRSREMFDALLPTVMLDGEPPSYKELAARIGNNETGTRVLVFRLRQD